MYSLLLKANKLLFESKKLTTKKKSSCKKNDGGSEIGVMSWRTMGRWKELQY